MVISDNKSDRKNIELYDIPQVHYGMQLVENELLKVISKSDTMICEIIKGLLNTGKKIRPKLVIISGMCFDELNEKMVYTAVASELIHTASLIHDDIIDGSDYRRNKPTINYTYGNYVAVLAGDFLFAKAFEILSNHYLTKCTLYFVKAIHEMCSGEILQSNRRFDISITEHEYILNISKKTASLISACCMAGAENAGEDDYVITLMGLFGYYMGCAFQIIDDILDITGNQEELGKPAAHDLTEGNISLPFIYLFEETRYKDRYKDVLNKKQIDREAKEDMIHDVLNSDSLLRAKNKAREYVDKAIESLCKVPQQNVYKELLIKMSLDSLERCY